MRENVQFQLTEETRRVLSQLDSESEIPGMIRAGSYCVGLLNQHSVPPGLVLPAGLEWSTQSVKVHDVKEEFSETEPVTLQALRYSGTMCMSAHDIDSVVRQVTESHMITLNDKVLGEQSLGDVVSSSSKMEPCDVKLYTSCCEQDTANGISFTTVTGNGTLFTVDFDCLAYCSLADSKRQILDLIGLSMKRLLSATFAVCDDGQVSMTHHRVLGGGLAVTFVSAREEDEQSRESTMRRKTVHNTLMLPPDRPMFRRICRAFAGASEFTDGGYSGRLTNVHNGIASPKLADQGVSVHMMQGTYLYCHYMQDKFNDSGWGCAYRSLQTILSWCAFERYIQFDGGKLPTHRQIQQALVDVGDKPGPFVGSKEWIGANEVCYVLEKLTGVSSKILHVSSGAEMESKGRELAQHFDTQGSPVMVGGGVLAWTILGVARDPRTGETKFLILDPHYKGRDELKPIQDKKWVAWKGGDAFVQNTFYNLCMPQRPSSV